jgi:hypothetical protein
MLTKFHIRKDDTDVCGLYVFFTIGKLIFEFFSLVNKTQQPFTQLIPQIILKTTYVDGMFNISFSLQPSFLPVDYYL